MRAKDLAKKSNRRVDTRFLQNLNIQSFGDDNLYPQTVHNIISASPTGTVCSGRLGDFIEGDGFREISFSALVVNHKGQTSDDIHSLVCKDMAEFNGFALHINYNIFGEIVEIQHIPFENCRLEEEDDNGYVARIAVHPDWSGQKTRRGKRIKVTKENIDYIDVFNPVKDVVNSQIERAGGIEFYKGQVLWVSMAGDCIYPTGKADSVVTEMSTDEGLANVKYRNVRNNFLPSSIVVTKKGSAVTFDNDGNAIEEDEDSSFSDMLKQMQGDTNAAKIGEVSIEADEEIPTVLPVNSQNYDKEFTVTDASVVERIYSAYEQEPWYCIRIGKVGFSGDILEDAFEYYNSIVGKQQRLIERTFERIFRHWSEPTTHDFSVKPLKYIRNAEVSNNPS